jgi:hypothetical protein
MATQYVYAIKGPENPYENVTLYGDKTRAGDPHLNYRVRFGARMAVVKVWEFDRFYEVLPPVAAADILFTNTKVYPQSFVRFEDVQTFAPEPEPGPEPEPEPGTVPTDAEVGRVIKYLFGGA